MEIDFIQELKKRDELLDGYLRQIEIQEKFIQKQKELIEYLEDHISKITDIVSSVQQDCTGGKRMPDTYDHYHSHVSAESCATQKQRTGIW